MIQHLLIPNILLAFAGGVAVGPLMHGNHIRGNNKWTDIYDFVCVCVWLHGVQTCTRLCVNNTRINWLNWRWRAPLACRHPPKTISRARFVRFRFTFRGKSTLPNIFTMGFHRRALAHISALTFLYISHHIQPCEVVCAVKCSERSAFDPIVDWLRWVFGSLRHPVNYWLRDRFFCCCF